MPTNAKQLLSDALGDHLSVKMFGAIGDGVTDDSVSFQSAISYAVGHRSFLYVPPGVYLTSATLNIPGSLILYGASGTVTRKTVILYSGSGIAVQVLNPTPTSGVPWVFRFYLRNLSINSTLGWNVATIGLDLHNVSEFEVKDVLVGTSNATGFGIGIRGALDIGVLSGIIPAGNHVGFFAAWMDEPLGPIVPCTSVEICGASNFFNNDTPISIAGLVDSHIHNCWFEQFKNAFLFDNALSPAAGCVVHNVTVDNNGFSGYTTGAYTDNRALRVQSSDNTKVVSIINFRCYENSCFAVGTHVMEFVVTGSHANTLFEGSIHHNELWGGTAGAINADSSAKIFVMLMQNDSRDSFFGTAVPDVDPAALISANGFDFLFNDFLYATFKQGIKTQFTSKFNTPLGDAVFVEGPDKAYISFIPDGGVTTQAVLGFPTTSNLAFQIINNVTGKTIVIQTNGGSILMRGGAVEVDGGYGALGLGSINPTFGGGGSAPNVGSLSIGDGTGNKWVIGTAITGVFTPRFLFNDKGILEFAAGSNIYCGSGSPETVVTAPVGSMFLRTDGSSTTALYLKASGTGNTGWLAVNVSASGAITALTGDVTATGPGSVAATVAAVGGSTAALVHAAELLANAAVSTNTASRIVKRDGSGGFAGQVINAEASVGAVHSTVGTANLVVGSASRTGYLEFKMTPVGTRRGYIGNDTTDLTVNLENSSKFIVSGGDMQVPGNLEVGSLSLFSPIGPVTLTLAKITGGGSMGTPVDTDSVQTLTNKTLSTGCVLSTGCSVGGSAPADVHTAELAANAATSSATANTVAKRDGSGGVEFQVINGHGSVGAVATGKGSVNMIVGTVTETGYIQWIMPDGTTRLGYIGNDAANVTVNLENLATFQIVGGAAYIQSPADASKAVVTCDGTQTLTGKTITGPSATEASGSYTVSTGTIGFNLQVNGGVAPAGLYRVSWYLVVTVSGTGTFIGVGPAWDDGVVFTQGQQTATPPTAGQHQTGSQIMYTTGFNNMSLTVYFTGMTINPTYKLFYSLEKIGG